MDGHSDAKDALSPAPVPEDSFPVPIPDGNGEPKAAAAGAPSVAIPTSHPPAIWFFFWGEFAERSSYYGMRTILMLYLTTTLHFADTTAAPVYNAFKMACYFLPLLGGYIADRWLGRYWTIVGFSVPYVLGQFLIGIPSQVTLFLALALLAGGSGVIKPNISTLMGQTYDQKRPGQETLRSAAFLWFYLSINIGALISSVALPIVRDVYMRSHLSEEAEAEVSRLEKEGKEVVISKLASQEVRERANTFAFMFPAGLMVLALGVFAAGKPTYALETPGRHELTPEERRLQWQTLWKLFGIFALVVLFWVGYEHNDTLWVAFIRDYVDLRLPFRLPFVGSTIPPDLLQFLNALFVVISIPVFNYLFRRLDPKVKIFTPMRKILAGFLLTAASIGLMSAAGFLATPTAKVSKLWPAFAYIILTLGEVLLYGTMLELAYAAAPKSMKGFVTACFLMTSALGNLVNVGWSPMYGGSLVDDPSKRGPLAPGPFFAITMGIVLAGAVGFLFIGRRFQAAEEEQAALPATDTGRFTPSGPEGGSDGIQGPGGVQPS
jgi:POT family proton-dependent oligopeptide transporter